MAEGSQTDLIAVERELQRLHEVLQKLIGFHRQLHETCKLEREALVAADVRAIQEQTSAKEMIVELIKQQETLRLRITAELSLNWKIPAPELTLNRVVLECEVSHPALSQSLRSAMNALLILIKRAKDINESNHAFLVKSLEHVNAMKRNVLGEGVPKSDTYGPAGQKQPTTGGSRLISKEA